MRAPRHTPSSRRHEIRGRRLPRSPGERLRRPVNWSNMPGDPSGPGFRMAETGIPGLLRRLAGGEQGALAEVYDRYAGMVHGLALRILRDAAEAEDVVQEAFMQVWRQASRYDAQRGTPEAWVCTIARTRALDRLRRRASRREESSEGAPPRSE